MPAKLLSAKQSARRAMRGRVAVQSRYTRARTLGEKMPAGERVGTRVSASRKSAMGREELGCTEGR
jgi:hypothetical protein